MGSSGQRQRPDGDGKIAISSIMNESGPWGRATPVKQAYLLYVGLFVPAKIELTLTVLSGCGQHESPLSAPINDIPRFIWSDGRQATSE